MQEKKTLSTGVKPRRVALRPNAKATGI